MAVGFWGNLPLLIVASRETAGKWLFFAGGFLGGQSLFLLLVGAAGFDLFLVGFLLVGLRGSIAHGI